MDKPGPGFAGTITVEQDEERPERRRPDLARVATDVDVPAGAGGQYRLVIPGELASVKPVVRLFSGGQVLAEFRVEGVAVELFLPAGPRRPHPGLPDPDPGAVEILSPEMAAVRAGATVVTARGGDLTVQAAPGMLAGPGSGSTNRTAVLVQ